MNNGIQDLLIFPCWLMTPENQLKIIKEGILRPNLNIADANLGFKNSIYEEVQWITGCTVTNRFYCWPCLLFGKQPSEWNKKGVTHSLFKKVCRHEMTQQHISAELQLKMFTLKNIKTSGSGLEIEVNDIIPKNDNRKVFNMLIDAVCRCIAKERAPLAEDDSYCGRFQHETCIHYLNLVRSHGSGNLKIAADAIEQIKKSPKMMNLLVRAIISVLKSAIKEEISFSTYVSIILSQHSSVASRPFVSTVLRYIKGGKIHERFIGFANICSNSGDVFKHILSVLDEFEISDKFLAYSLDGGILNTDALIEFTKMVKDKHPLAYFVHSIFHIIEQSLSHFKECNKFFKGMNGLIKYFTNSKRLNAYNKFMIEKNGKNRLQVMSFENLQYWKGSSSTWLNLDSITMTVYKHRHNMLEFFFYVLSNVSAWDEETIALTFAYRKYLFQLETVFMVDVFNKIFNLLMPVYECLKEDRSANIFSSSCVDMYIDDLKTLLHTGLDQAWKESLTTTGLSDCPPDQTDYQILFVQIISHVIADVTIRFEDAKMKELEFSQLMLTGNYITPIPTVIDDHITNLISQSGHNIDTAKLVEELSILNKHVCFIPKENIPSFFFKSGTQTVLPNVSRLTDFSYTLPVTNPRITPTTETQSVPTVDQMQLTVHIPVPNSTLQSVFDNKWSNYQNYLVTEDDKTILNVELELLKKLNKTDKFHSDVFSVFSEICEKRNEAQENDTEVFEKTVHERTEQIKLETF